jgi:hypothetical protein
VGDAVDVGLGLAVGPGTGGFVAISAFVAVGAGEAVGGVEEQASETHRSKVKTIINLVKALVLVFMVYDVPLGTAAAWAASHLYLQAKGSGKGLKLDCHSLVGGVQAQRIFSSKQFVAVIGHQRVNFAVAPIRRILKENQTSDTSGFGQP